MKDIINFLLCGVGGQGTILASDVLVNVGIAAGYQAKQAEVHGMSQRGGSVTSHVRWGDKIHSPLIGAGEVDVLLAFEKLEALRNIKFLRTNALAIINTHAIMPLGVISGDQHYPSDETLHQVFSQVTTNIEYLNCEEIALSLGNLRVENVILLGALSELMERSSLSTPELTAETWSKVITERVPAKHVEINRKAFQVGRQVVGKPQED
jgi:indolepyruvate ferredoxin oxidoreductase beta subunit